MRIRRWVVVAAAVAVAFGVATERANAAFSVHIGSNTLTVTGDAASDTLALRLAPGDPHTLILDVGNNGSADFTANRLLFNTIVVNAGAGNDSVLIDESKGAFTDQEATTLNGQDGNDTLTGGRGPETLIGADGNDRVTGGRGNDVALLGKGDDTFVWNAGDESDTVEGEAGTDTLDFHGSSASENIDLSANGNRLRLTRDVGSVVMDAAAVEHVSVHVGGGTDTLTVNSLAGTGVNRVDADLGGTDGAVDTVTVNGTAGADSVSVSAVGGVVQANTGAASVFVSNTEPAHDTLQVNTLAGSDSVSLFPGVSQRLRLNVDGGADADTILPTGTNGPDSVQLVLSAIPSTVDVSLDGGSTFAHVLASDVSDRIDVQTLGGADTILAGNGLAGLTPLVLDGGPGPDTITGGDGNDILIGGDDSDTVTGGRGIDTAFLGNGDDTFVWNPGDSSDTIEGQAGTDTLDFHGANIAEKFNLSANGGRLLMTRDVANIVMDANDVEHVTVHALGGADTLTVNSLAGTSVNRIDTDLAFGGGGDGAADTIVVNATNGADSVTVSAAGGVVQANMGPASVFVSGAEPANDALQVNTLAGSDSVSFFRGVSALLSLNVDGGADADTVFPTGTAGPDSVQLVLSAIPSTVDVSMDGGSSFAHVLASDVSDRIDVQTLGGADTIVAGNGLSTLTPLVLDGGPGPDTITGGDGNDILIGGDDSDTVTGGRGIDTAFLGNGDDTFVWNPGDSSDTVEGQAGTDTLDFHGSNANEKIDLSANGGRLRLNRDVAAIVMDANAVEHVTVHLLGGTDQLTVNSLAGTDVTRVDADLGAFGGGGDGASDTVIVNGTAGADSVPVTAGGGVVNAVSGPTSVFVSNAEPANDALQVNTLAGSDSVSFFRGVSALLSLNVDGGADADTVFPTGTAGPDSVQLVLSAIPSTVDVSMDGGSSFAHVLASDVSDRIDVQTLGGADTIVAGNGLSTLTPLVLDGGPGPDTITGGDGNDILIGGDDSDTVTGGRGIDTAFLGNGDDTFVWNPGDSSDTVEGQAGTDTLDFHGSNANEKIDLSANGGRLRLNRDVAAIVMDANAVEHVTVHLLGGTDQLTVNSLAGTDVTRVDADLGAFGGGGDGASDTVTVNGTPVADTVGITPLGSDVRVSGLAPVFVSNAEAANDRVIVNTLAGNDSVTASSGLAALIKVVVDGGLDADTIQGGDGDDTLFGDDGPDTIRGMAGNDSLFGDAGKDFLNGGPGADTFSCGGAGDTLVTDAFDTIGPDC